METVGPETPLVVTLRVRLDGQFLAPRVLPLPLVEREDRAFGVVLVHLHVILQVLIGGGGGKDEPVGFPFQRQAVVEHPPPVGTGIVDADGLDGTRCRVVLPVREGALRHIVVIQVVGCLQPVGDAPVQLEASASRLFLVCFCTRIFVGKESVVAVIIAA